MFVRDDSYDLEDNDSSIIAEVVPDREPPGAFVRFINFLFDYTLYGIVLLGFLFVYFTIIMVSTPGLVLLLSSILAFFKSPLGALMGILLVFTSSIVFFTLLEASTRGRSLGKLITGTRAVEADGSPLTYKSAALRSLCRTIPFEGLGALWGAPLHDMLTKTKVVNNS